MEISIKEGGKKKERTLGPVVNGKIWSVHMWKTGKSGRNGTWKDPKEHVNILMILGIRSTLHWALNPQQSADSQDFE